MTPTDLPQANTQGFPLLRTLLSTGNRESERKYEAALGRAILSSERLRVTIVIGLLCLFLATTILFFPLVPEIRGWSVQGRWGVTVIGSALLMALVLGYELLVYRSIGKYLRTQRQPPRGFRYVTAVVETSLPTLIIMLASQTVDPLHALTLPASMGYFACIALTTLSLRFEVCLFAGAVAALEYVTLALLTLASAAEESLEHHRLLAAHYMSYGVILLVTGFVAGQVATLIRGQFVMSLRSVEEHNRVLEVFGKYISPEVVDQLLTQKVELAGERRTVCILFLDIRDFTKFASTRPPEEVVQYLNTLFHPLIESVNGHQGMINKFLGDGFLAVFGAPHSTGRDIANAVAAALDILERVAALNAAGAVPPTRVGMGIHAGDAVVGTVGSTMRKEYTIIGGTVNLAARIEQLNKQFDSQLLVSEEVWRTIAADFPTGVALPPIEVKGEAAPVQVYRLA